MPSTPTLPQPIKMLVGLKALLPLVSLILIIPKSGFGRGEKYYDIQTLTEAADIILIGKVKSSKKTKACYLAIEVTPLESLKGKVSATVDLCLSGVTANANYDVKLNKKALFFLNYNGKKYVPADIGAWVAYIESHNGHDLIYPSGRLTRVTSKTSTIEVEGHSESDLDRVLVDLGLKK